MENNKQQCACCGYFTHESNFDICSVCFWQKDLIQEENIDDAGGPNRISLRDARVNYKEFGAMDQDFITNVKAPYEDEIQHSLNHNIPPETI